MKEVLRHPLEDGVLREEPEVSHAIMLTHAFGAAFGLEEEHAEKEICGVPAHMLMYLVRNAALYREDDAYAAMDRTVRLWREFGLKVPIPRASSATRRGSSSRSAASSTPLLERCWLTPRR